MNILFYFGHPSQYLFLKNAISALRLKGINCDIVIKSKDILEQLLKENSETYINILPEGRKSGRFGFLTGLVKRNFRLFRYVMGKNYNILIGTDPSLAHIGFLKRISVVTVLEDDIDVIPELARITFPFTSLIFTPEGCKTGKYEKKTIHYRGYMKLAYLHPNHFIKRAATLKQPYFLIRVSKLDAYHDSGIKGFKVPLLIEVICKLKTKGSVHISSEGKLDESLKKYELKINPAEMQQILANASILISDSQSMTMEAAMLGIPSIRFSDFAGRISVLEELEHRYGLTFGISANFSEQLFDKIDELLAFPDLEMEFQRQRELMLKDKIDVTAFLVWFIENFPESVDIIRANPEYQERFR